MKMSIEENRLKSVLSHVAAKCCINDWYYRRGEVSEAIENYFGVLEPVAVIGQSNKEEVIQHVFMKLPPLQEVVRSCIGYMWDAEAFVYFRLVPLWKSISNVKFGEIIPECYYADATPNNQILLLKDMCYEGFQKYEKDRFFDHDHVIVALKTLAQFHACSIITKEKKIVLNDFVLRPYNAEYPPKLNIALKHSVKKHTHLFKGTKYEEYLNNIINDFGTIVVESVTKAKYLVYGHGDYWKENILYKYEKRTPVQACMFDFQTCRVMSPAHDLLYFLLNCTTTTLRRQYFQHFITTYYTMLRDILSDNGVRLEKLYTMEDLVFDLKVTTPICVIRLFMAFSLWLGLEDSGIIKSKNIHASAQQRIEKLQCFKEIIEDILTDLYEYGYTE